jgi:hypothetical protein
MYVIGCYKRPSGCHQKENFYKCNCLAVEALKTSKDIHAQNQTNWFSSITEIFDYFQIEKNIKSLI